MIKQLLIAIDQLLNVFPFFGYADETISARLYRNRDNSFWWKFWYNIVNKLFFWQNNHCRGAFGQEQARKQLPVEYRV